MASCSKTIVRTTIMWVKFETVKVNPLIYIYLGLICYQYVYVLIPLSVVVFILIIIFHLFIYRIKIDSGGWKSYEPGKQFKRMSLQRLNFLVIQKNSVSIYLVFGFAAIYTWAFFVWLEKGVVSIFIFIVLRKTTMVRKKPLLFFEEASNKKNNRRWYSLSAIVFYLGCSFLIVVGCRMSMQWEICRSLCRTNNFAYVLNFLLQYSNGIYYVYCYSHFIASLSKCYCHFMFALLATAIFVLLATAIFVAYTYLH